MKADFLNTISEFNMLEKGDRVLVGLSGGADSVCLMHLLLSCRDELGIELAAAHINHCIRGEEADRDEAFVRDFCEHNGIKLYVLRADIPALAKERGESTELCARNIRYDYFNSLSYDKIATAHTGSDRIETFLMNLTRGSALNGLCSIPAVRGNIIRPLINFTRIEIEEYCKISHLEYVTDSTNLSDDYTRNKFRHAVVNDLRDINPSFEKNALRCIKSLNLDNQYINQEVERLYNELINEQGQLDVRSFSAFSVNIQKRLLVKFIYSYCNSDVEEKHLNYIVANISESFSISLPGNKNLLCNGAVIYFQSQENINSIDTVKIPLGNNIKISQLGKTIELVFTESCDAFENCYLIDADKICGDLMLRARRSGDIIHLRHRKCSKSLKKLFNEMKIPSFERESLFILADDNGVIFVEGVGVDSGRLIDSKTKKYVIIRMEEEHNV